MLVALVRCITLFVRIHKSNVPWDGDINNINIARSHSGESRCKNAEADSKTRGL